MRSLLLVNVIMAGLGVTWAKSLTKSGLQVEVTKEVRCKENKKAENGDKVTVHYGGFLQDGKNLSLIYCEIVNLGLNFSTSQDF